MEKGTRVEQIDEAARRLRARRHRGRLLPAVRLSGRDAGGHRADARRWCATAGPTTSAISVSYPLPGTPFHERVRRQLGAKQNWLDSDDLAMMYRAPFVPDFYRALHARWCTREFRGAPRASNGSWAGRVAASWAGGPSRDLLAGALAAARLPLLRRRLERLAVSPNPERRAAGAPLLSRRSAAIPTEQPQ